MREFYHSRLSVSGQDRINEYAKRRLANIKIDRENMLKTGTVHVAIKFGNSENGGVVTAADHQISSWGKRSGSMDKIKLFSDFSTIGFAGSVLTIKATLDIIDDVLRYGKKEPDDLYLEGQATVIYNVLQTIGLLTDGYCDDFLFTGMDVTGPVILSYSGGCELWEEKFASIGSGETDAIPLLLRDFEFIDTEALSEKGALKFAYSALRQVGRRDLGVGDSDKEMPQIIVVKASDSKILTDDEVRQIREEVLQESKVHADSRISPRTGGV